MLSVKGSLPWNLRGWLEGQECMQSEQKGTKRAGFMKNNPEDNDFLAKIFNAIPLNIFVVDDDVKILFWNAAAASLMSKKRGVYRKRCGDVFHFIHSDENPGGCGRSSFCKECIIRNSVYEAIGGNQIYRMRTMVRLKRRKKTIDIPLLITTAPFQDEDKRLCLLMIEDISELIQLRNLIPICMKCKKIRDESGYWESVEDYISDHIIDLEFSHGYCPACGEKMLKDVKKYAEISGEKSRQERTL